MSRSKQPLSIEHAILGFLREQPVHGYEIHQRLIAPEALGPIWPLKQAQFYALANRLAEEGYLTVSAEQRGTLPPRKLLRLTPAGMVAFITWLHGAAAVGDDAQREFLARLYFARQLGPATLRQLLLHERQQRREQFQALRGKLQTFVPHSYPWLVTQWQVRQVEASLDWLDTFGLLPAAPGVVYPIAVLADSPVAALASRFVAYVCGPAGQTVLARFGFLPAGAAPPALLAETPAPLRGRLIAYAASSLTPAFETLGAAFSAEHPEVSVHFTFGGSQDLAAKLAQGADCDIYTPAHEDAMEAVIAAGRVTPGTVATLVRNQLAIVTSAHGGAQPQSLGDLARPGLRLAFGSMATAVGRYTQDMLTAATFDGSLGKDGPAAVLHNVVYYAETVTDVLAKVASGEVDAGIVFTSDYHRAPGDVQVTAVAPR